MLEVDRKYLPSSTELPDSDDTPVDNEDQNWLPNVLLLLLKYIWADRTDWFFGIDMGVYHLTGLNHRFPVVPDGFLSTEDTKAQLAQALARIRELEGN
jgi:Uma2 family endonuclease